MKTYNNNPENMLDMIFENKNKNYGAYAIRNAYNDTVIKALTIVASSLLLLVGSSLAYNNYFKEKPIEKVTFAEQIETIVPIDVTPIAQPEQKIEQSASGAASTAISTVFTNESIEPLNPNTSLSLVTSTGDTSNVIDPNGVAPGTSTITVVATPPVTVVEPVVYAEVMPEFPGGTEALINYLQNNMKYPQIELEAGIGGRVFVKFVVNADGSISTAEILKGVAGGEGLSKEALRVVRAMPKWKPGKQGDNYVPVYFNLPIKFTPN
ncbi:MAG: energy transducer TonB [Bacteroidia bacterium]